MNNKPLTVEAPKRYNSSEWVAILEDQSRNELSASEVAAKYNIPVGMVFNQISKSKSEAEVAKEPVAKKHIRRSKQKWLEILKAKEVNKLSASEVSEMYNVSEASIYSWANKLKKELIQESEIAKPISPDSVINNLYKLIDNIDLDLAGFEKEVEAAQALVDNANSRRSVFTEAKNNYLAVIELMKKAEVN